MNMTPMWICLAAAFAIGHCQLRSDDGETCPKRNYDAYMERVLTSVREELEDPMRLPPKATFVDLTDGLLWGMSELSKVEPPTVNCEDGKTITIELKLTTEQLKGRYTWKREQKKRDRTGYVVFMSNDFEAEATIVIELEEGQESHPRLEKFVINKFKDAKIEITGMGFFSWALGEMTTLMSGIFQRSIAHAVEGPVREALERKMREISIHE